jgi:hypothetical protein
LSVRVCYVERAERGTTVRSLRLVGLAQDEQWSADSGTDPDAGAAWVKQVLSGTRDSSALALLCLDVEGGVCSWLTSPSANPSVVAALARQGAPDGEGARAGGPVEFYAADSFSSSIQPLDGRPGANGAAPRLRKSALPPEPQRLAILGMTDVPVRLLMDALDREGIPVESVASLWHIMAAAWDPSAPRAAAPADALQGETASLTAVILVDPSASRLVWCWSKAGTLVVAGSMRLRQAQADANALAQPGDAAPTTVQYGEPEVSRLANEWLSWAAQLGQAPGRFVCVLPDGDQGGEFGRALGRTWSGATVDVVTNDDPVGATLKRTANVLENTPIKAGGPDQRTGLVDLSRRPGAQHRRMYVWWAGAVGAAAMGLTVVGFQLRGAAESARTAALGWRNQGRDAIAQVAPDIKDAPGKNRYQAFEDEVKRLEHQVTAPPRNDDTMPVMEELETISLVVGNAGYALDSISLDSKGLPRFAVVADNMSDAEALIEAMRRVSGSNVVEWTGNPVPRKVDGVDKVAVTFNGRWAPPKPGGQR